MHLEKNWKAAAAIAVVVFIVMAAFAFSGNGAQAKATATPTSRPSSTALPTLVPTPTPTSGNLQVISIRALPNEQYDHETITVNAGQPVRLDFSADPSVSCGTTLVIRKFGITLTSQNGQTVSTTFTPTDAGTYSYSCPMGMWSGTLIVK